MSHHPLPSSHLYCIFSPPSLLSSFLLSPLSSPLSSSSPFSLSSVLPLPTPPPPALGTSEQLERDVTDALLSMAKQSGKIDPDVSRLRDKHTQIGLTVMLLLFSTYIPSTLPPPRSHIHTHTHTHTHTRRAPWMTWTWRQTWRRWSPTRLKSSDSPTRLD